jgi:hypothetical protein
MWCCCCSRAAICPIATQVAEGQIDGGEPGLITEISGEAASPAV